MCHFLNLCRAVYRIYGAFWLLAANAGALQLNIEVLLFPGPHVPRVGVRVKVGVLISIKISLLNLVYRGPRTGNIGPWELLFQQFKLSKSLYPESEMF